eukprot:4650157-Lingulodinium_polyedra.AAC.1
MESKYRWYCRRRNHDDGGDGALLLKRRGHQCRPSVPRKCRAGCCGQPRKAKAREHAALGHRWDGKLGKRS